MIAISLVVHKSTENVESTEFWRVGGPYAFEVFAFLANDGRHLIRIGPPLRSVVVVER